MCNSNCNKCVNGKLPNITSAYFILTERCNLKCKYCFVHQNPKEMTIDVAMAATKFLIRNAEECGETPEINFFGGEPTLKWEEIIVPVTEYIRNYYRNPFKLSMTTNGTLLTTERIKYLKDNNFGLLLSIDGNEKSQDFNRAFHNGKGSFKRVNSNIDDILKSYPQITFRGTVFHESVHTLKDSMIFAIDRGFLNSFFIPDVFAEWTNDEKNILAEQIHEFVDYWIEMFRAGKKFNYLTLTRVIRELPKINERIDYGKDYRLDMTNGLNKCGLGASKFSAIGTDGKIWGCHEMTTNLGDEWVIGDIYNGVNDALRHNLISKFDGRKFKGKDYDCEKCPYSPICDCGCVANNHLITGDINTMPSMFCFWSNLLLHEAKRMVHVLGNEENELFKELYSGIDWE